MVYKISCLLFAKDANDRLLLLQRAKSPNKGLWSPPGGKLEMSIGESPVECAIRESSEELGINLHENDLHLFGYVAEKNYEGNGHWLMFLFDVLREIDSIPKMINEGFFDFFHRNEINQLDIPPTDHRLVWPYFDKRKEGFWGIRANFGSKSTKIKVEAKPI
jgi:8-oxo-dGTP diphosphatase